MKEQFADYETSKMLKELQLNKICFGFYAYNSTSDQYILLDRVKTNGPGNVVAAPLWQQVEEWLWENHKIFVSIEQYKYEFQFFVWHGKQNFCLHDDDICFDSPILAKIKGIQAVVKFLYKDK